MRRRPRTASEQERSEREKRRHRHTPGREDGGHARRQVDRNATCKVNHSLTMGKRSALAMRRRSTALRINSKSNRLKVYRTPSNLAQYAYIGAQETAAPNPVSDRVVNKELPQEQVQKVGAEAEATEERARLQQGRDGGEHHLEYSEHMARDARRKRKASICQ